MDISLSQILLAESDSSEIALIRSSINREFQDRIAIVNSYSDLLENIDRQRSKLVILGNIDKSNYSEIVQACHKIKENLPIVLLTRQRIIINSFRKLVKTCGLTDVIARDSGDLNQLLQTLYKPLLVGVEERLPQQKEDRQTDRVSAQSSIVGRMMLAALEEIVTISDDYFGPLAQGNYWRKAHARILIKFPSLQYWSADHFRKLSCDASILDRELTDKDIQSLRLWVQFFIEECERSVVDYRVTLNNSNLSPPAQYLLTES
jgi:hypothetical protein